MFFYLQSLFSYKLDFSNGRMSGLENFSFRDIFSTNNSIFSLLSHEIMTLSLLFQSFFIGLKAFATNLLLISPLTTSSLFSPNAYISSLLNGFNWQMLYLNPGQNFSVTTPSELVFTTNTVLTRDDALQQQFQSQEIASDYRNLRLQNPIFKYDFKLGNYMPDDNKRKFSQLLTSIHDLTTGVKKPN